MRSVLAEDSRASVTALALGPNPAFEVLVSTIISLRTRDEVTYPRSRVLLDLAPSARALASLPEQAIAEAIYPAAFYRQKAKNLRTIANILVDQYQGKVPTTEEALLALPGVGRKTATLVLGLGHRIPAICVDTHVHRIYNRLGFGPTASPDATEAGLRSTVPVEEWIGLNDTMVLFGQQVCTPQSPRCSECPLTASCPRTGVLRAR